MVNGITILMTMFLQAGHCYIHIAALVAEYLKKRGKLVMGNINPLLHSVVDLDPIHIYRNKKV